MAIQTLTVDKDNIPFFSPSLGTYDVTAWQVGQNGDPTAPIFSVVEVSTSGIQEQGSAAVLSPVTFRDALAKGLNEGKIHHMLWVKRETTYIPLVVGGVAAAALVAWYFLRKKKA
jgi:LPXTG-motif cell wall-anchored protein